MRTTRDPGGVDAEEFRALGHRLVDRLSDFLASIPDRPVCQGTSLGDVQAALGRAALPARGKGAEEILDRAMELLFDHSVLVSHPRFWAYVHGSASALGVLGDFLASAVNSPVTSRMTGPMSSAIEAEATRWMAELVGFPPRSGGLFLSGGSMATLVALSAALSVKAGWDVRSTGLTAAGGDRLRLYATADAHSCVASAAVLTGLGIRAIHAVPTDDENRMIPDELRRRIEADLDADLKPVLAVGTAGTTSTGAVDPLPDIAEICREYNLWFHVDGAYGGAACLSSEAPRDILGLREADSLVIDPHKWLYMPLEAGCLLMRNNRVLYDTFCHASTYYSLSGDSTGLGAELLPLRDQSPQTSRGFRALKVWLALQQRGREGYRRMITEDIQMARHLHALAEAHPRLQACSQGLSVTTFRYVPPDMAERAHAHRQYLDDLNRELLRRLQESGEAYPSHTTVRGVYALRVCIVNQYTTRADIEALPDVVARIGDDIHATMSGGL